MMKLSRFIHIRNTYSNTAITNASARFLSSQPSKKLFDKILIANRGEIACRVIRTAKKLGIKTVAVYSDADKNSQHVQQADEAVYIGASPASESYLRGDKIIEACLKTGAQAVHPGYGFLSENLPFCQLCTDSNIVFIGPPPKAIKAMGSKSESKDIMIKAGVPVTPGYHGNDQSNANLLKQATIVGYPLMIKAVSGGGGKGMRAVFEESKFIESLESCRREALKSFGDEAVLIEKLVQSPRHVELQVFGDMHGDAVHLLERDCSVQRRHQKVLEEAPAINLAPHVRKAMGDAAVACAKAVGYVGAGTVEFLVDSVTSDFYFCEMNTRLQVEHPVTEMITGTDLVEWQLKVASGQHLPMTQDEILKNARGHAIEARIYAENPLKDFLPTTGKLEHMKASVDSIKTEDDVRVDSGVVSGDTVSTFYDPMIAKLIVHADNRPAALEKLERALRDFQVAGLPNNIDFLIKIVRHDGFTKVQATTAFFDLHMKDLLDSLDKPSLSILRPHTIFAVSGATETNKLNNQLAAPWGSDDSWRGYGGVKSSLHLSYDLKDNTNVIIESFKNGSNTITTTSTTDKNTSSSINYKVISKSLHSHNGTNAVWHLSLEIGSVLYSGTVSIYENQTSKAKVVDVWIEGQIGDKQTHSQIQIPYQNHELSSSATGKPTILSPMPGKVIKVLFTDGSTVKKGDTIAIIEAMKMEHTISAPCDGVVTVNIVEGSTIGEGFKIAEISA